MILIAASTAKPPIRGEAQIAPTETNLQIAGELARIADQLEILNKHIQHLNNRMDHRSQYPIEVKVAR
jgi:hypothetical protein